MKNVFLKENTIENDKEQLGRSITSLGYSTEKECRNIRQLPSSNDAESKIIMNIVFKNFSELVTLSQDNNTDIPQKIYKEYHEIVYLLITERRYGWDYYFNTIQKYGRDKLNDFNYELLKGIDAFKCDDLFNNMTNLDNLIKSKIIYNGVKD